MDVEVKIFAGGQRPAIQVPGAENERAGPVREATGRVWSQCAPFKDACIYTTRMVFHVVARRRAGDVAQNCSQCAAQSVGGVPVSEPHCIDGLEMEADPEKLELHATRV